MNFLKGLIIRLIAFCFWCVFYIIAFWALVWFLLGIDVMEGLNLLEKTWPVRTRQISHLLSYVTQKASTDLSEIQEDTSNAPAVPSKTAEPSVPSEETTVDPNLLPDVEVRPAPEKGQLAEPERPQALILEEQTLPPVMEPAEPEILPAEDVVMPDVVPLPEEVAEPSVTPVLVQEEQESVIEPFGMMPVREEPASTAEVVEPAVVEPAVVEPEVVEPEPEPEVIEPEPEPEVIEPEVVEPEPVVVNPEGVEPVAPTAPEVIEPAEPVVVEPEGVDPAESVSSKAAPEFPGMALPLLPEDGEQMAAQRNGEQPAELQTVINPGAMANHQE